MLTPSLSHIVKPRRIIDSVDVHASSKDCNLMVHTGSLES